MGRPFFTQRVYNIWFPFYWLCDIFISIKTEVYYDESKIYSGWSGNHKAKPLCDKCLSYKNNLFPCIQKFAVEQSLKGIKSPEIFRSAGFDPEMLGKPRMYAALKKFKKEAASPEGLREPRGKSREEKLAEFAKSDLSKKQTKTAIRELQEKVIHLEQQIEFLKKIQSAGK